MVIISLVVNTSAVDYLERLHSEMTYYVSSGTLDSTDCVGCVCIMCRVCLQSGDRH